MLTRLSKPPLLVLLVKRKRVRAEPHRRVAGVVVIVVEAAVTSVVVIVAAVAVAIVVEAVAVVTAVDSRLLGV
jgi:hypothetical protein